MLCLAKKKTKIILILLFPFFILITLKFKKISNKKIIHSPFPQINFASLYHLEEAAEKKNACQI
jgi:hypothetical protein